MVLKIPLDFKNFKNTLFYSPFVHSFYSLVRSTSLFSQSLFSNGKKNHLCKYITGATAVTLRERRGSSGRLGYRCPFPLLLFQDVLTLSLSHSLFSSTSLSLPLSISFFLFFSLFFTFSISIYFSFYLTPGALSTSNVLLLELSLSFSVVLHITPSDTH